MLSLLLRQSSGSFFNKTEPLECLEQLKMSPIVPMEIISKMIALNCDKKRGFLCLKENYL